MRRTLRVTLFVFISTCCSFGIRAQPNASANWKDQSPHEVRFVSVASDVKLEVLDWGGPPGATPLVFLAGLTNNAHAFDDFAPRFVDRYHVLGLTRRGHGASSWPASGYDIATLVHDIRSALDSLGLQRVILAGHSLAGAELTRLAADEPERVVGLIYIDAAYDLTKAPFTECANANGPEATQDAMRRFKNPELVLHTQLKVGDDGTPRPYASEVAVSQILMSQSSPDYSHVLAPALAAYYLPARIEDVIPNPSDQCREAAQRYYYEGVAEFVEGVRHATVVTIANSQHNLHLATPDALEAAMDSWLAKLEKR